MSKVVAAFAGDGVTGKNGKCRFRSLLQAGGGALFRRHGRGCSVRKALVLAVLFAAFAGAMPTASAAEIGVILAGKVLGIWLGMTRGIERAAEDLHVGLVVRSPADGVALGTQRNI